MSNKYWTPCTCGNGDPIQFRQYRDSDGELIGKFCKKCETEWFKADAFSTDVPDSASCESDDLFNKKPIKQEINTVFQIKGARTKIDIKYFAEILQKGDHITWHRVKGIWHHSIVTDIDAEKNEIEVIHWGKKGSVLKIYQERLLMIMEDDNSLFNNMYRIEYDDDVIKSNPVDLVLSRARSRIGDTGYGLLSDNCEAFATYCKTGQSQSHQVEWFKEKVKECLGLGNIKAIAKIGVQNVAKAAKGIPLAAKGVIPSEVIEEALNASESVGAGVVIMIETGFVIWDLSKAYSERKHGNITRQDFIEAAIRRVTEGISAAGAGIASAIGAEIGAGCLFGIMFGPIGVVVGGIIGGIVGGIAGNAIGRVIGTWGGSVAGKIIARRFPNDRAITDIGNLQPGDHIVLSGWFLHPRCHAIVLDHNNENQVLVIRNTNKNGVTEEWMEVTPDLKKVEYKRGACLEPEEVIKNAKRLLGQTKYNLATYNCKTFARECKTIQNLQKV